MFFILPWKLKQPTPQTGAPVANLTLVAINVIVYLFGWCEFWAVGPGTRWLSVLTYAFCHASVWHLVVNMWAFWVFGNPVNRRIGNAFYLVAYLGTAVVLGLVARLLLSTYLAGSSGVLFAVIAIALILMPGAVLQIACVALFPLTVVVGLLAKPKQWWYWIVRWAMFSVPALWCLVLIPLIQLWSFFWSGWSWTPVAHLLGMVCGVAVVLLLPTRITMGRRLSAGIP